MPGPRPHPGRRPPPSPGPTDITLSTGVLRPVVRVFAVVLGALGAGHVLSLLVPSLALLSIADLADERSFGTWVGSSLHLLCAVLAAAGALLARRDGTRWTVNWWLLAAAFLAMSADETASAHDRLVVPLQERFDTSGVLLYPWVVAGLVLGSGFLLVQLGFLRSWVRPAGGSSSRSVSSRPEPSGWRWSKGSSPVRGERGGTPCCTACW